MGMLDRYKKKGGFIQLLQLIETSNKQKQEQFLAIVAQESVIWEAEIRKKTLTLDKIMKWNATYLAEIFSRIQILTLASAFHGAEQEKIDVVFKAITSTDQRKFQMTIQEINPNPAEKLTSQMKILSETRTMIAQNIIKLDKVAPDMMIPENVEERLSDAGFNMNPTPAAVHASAEKELKLETKAEIKADTAREEIEFLKKKVNQLVNENNMLKHDMSVLRNKLDQIRKIA
jgi:cell division protein FtsB